VSTRGTGSICSKLIMSLCHTTNLPTPAHGAKAPGLIFVSGQTALNEAGEKVPGGIEEHTVRARFAKWMNSLAC